MTTTLPRLDLLGVTDLLDETERRLQEAVADVAATRLAPLIVEAFESARFPHEVVEELGALGVLGMQLEGYGCAGANAVSYGLACLELEAVDSAFRSFVSVQGSLAMHAIHAYGSEEQRQRWLPEMAAGRSIGCFGLTEPDVGSNPAGMTTYARRDGRDWILRGTKTWITNGGISDVAVVWARTEAGIRGFLVEKELPGYTRHDITPKMSLRASVTSELAFDEVRLPDEALLPAAQGLRAPLSCLNEARYGIIWGALGAARTCLETARDYATSRVQFDRPIAAFQLTQEKLVRMAVAWDQGLLLAHHLGLRKDRGEITPQQVSFGKLSNVRESLAICREARTILGANGVSAEYPVMRHMNNLILGEYLTGESAFA
jgi:glutaryl-CoA dehydrogenase